MKARDSWLEAFESPLLSVDCLLRFSLLESSECLRAPWRHVGCVRHRIGIRRVNRSSQTIGLSGQWTGRAIKLIAVGPVLSHHLDKMPSDESIDDMPNDKSERLKAYLTAYQVAADRYENVYKSIWTIFSYMTAVSAGILSFGSSRFYGQPLAALGCAPLVFWFYTTYLPLNRYGSESLADLKRLEGILNTEFSIAAHQYNSFHKKREGFVGGLRRANTMIWIFLVLIQITFFYGAVVSYQKWNRGENLIKESSPQTVTIKLAELSPALRNNPRGNIASAEQVAKMAGDSNRSF